MQIWPRPGEPGELFENETMESWRVDGRVVTDCWGGGCREGEGIWGGKDRSRLKGGKPF